MFLNINKYNLTHLFFHIVAIILYNLTHLFFHIVQIVLVPFTFTTKISVCNYLKKLQKTKDTIAKTKDQSICKFNILRNEELKITS